MDPNEFEVYLDIDGAAEEDEDSVHSGDAVRPQPPANARLKAAQHLAQISRQAGGSSQKKSKAQHSLSAITSLHSARHHDSDTEEIDIDTPYDGKLMGQTNVKSESVTEASLLHRLLDYSRATSSQPAVVTTAFSAKPAVARKSTTAVKKTLGNKKSVPSLSVARKSTTQKPRGVHTIMNRNAAGKATSSTLLGYNSVAGSRSNVAKKSTTKQPRHSITSGHEEPLRPIKKKTTGKNILQVKFGAVTAHLKTPHSVTGSVSPSKAAGLSPRPIASGKTKIKLPVSSKAYPVHTPMARNKVFEINEKTGGKVSCPECSALIGQWCMRAHLKTVHNLMLKICKKCKMCFTDLNLYSEHYALHLQEEEDLSYCNYSSTLATDDQVASTGLQATRPHLSQKSQKTLSGKGSLVNANRHLTVGRDYGESASTSTVTYAKQKKAVKQVNKKRQLSPALVKASSKFGRFSNEVLLGSPEPMIQELPPKPRKPGNLSKRWHAKSQSHAKGKFRAVHMSSNRPRRKSMSTESQNDGYDSSTSSDIIYPVATRRPGPNSVNPFNFKRQASSVSESRIRHPSSYPSLRSQFLERNSGVTTNTSAQSDSESEEYFSSDCEEEKKPVSPYYKHKTAFRRGLSRELQQLTSPATKMCLHNVHKPQVVEDVKLAGKAIVSLVSLETASQPFDCETCWTAFQVALVCPHSFRQHCQSKPYACSKCPAVSTHHGQLEAHHYTAGSMKEEQDSEAQVMKRSVRQSDSLQVSSQASLEAAPPSGQKHSLFECPVCKETFQYRSMYLRHLPYHTFQYCCGICKKAFEEKVALMDHLQILHDGRMSLRCRYCEKRYKDVDEFEEHVYAHKSGTVVACTVCNKKFGNARLMHLHSKVTHGVTQGTFIPAKRPALVAKPIVTRFLSCRICNKVFHKVQGLAVHYKLHHGISKAAALSAVNTQKNITSAPQKVHGSQIPPRNNSISSETNTQQDPGPSHSDRGSATQPSVPGGPSDTQSTAFKCKLCDGILSTLHGLKVHYKIRHKQDLPKAYLKGAACFKCLPCDKWFSYRRSFTKHQRLFHASDVSVKPVASKAIKRRKKSLWQCKFCEKSFSLRKYMRLHVKAEHPRKYVDERLGTRKCMKCDKNFGSKNILASHLKVCNVKRATPKVKIGGNCPGTFICSLCKKTFRWKSNFVRHMEQTHGMSKEEIAYDLTRGQHEPKKPQPKQHGLNICKVCKSCFPKKSSLSTHIQKRHGGRTDIFECRFQFCKKHYSSNKSLLKHRQKFHPGKALYRCQGCGSGFQYTYEIPGHRCEDIAGSTLPDFQDEGDDGPEVPVKECRYRCQLCGQGFHIAREWTRHMQEHKNSLQLGEASDPEQDVNATDETEMKYVSVMPASSVSRPRPVPHVMKKGKIKNMIFRKSKTEPVKCTICLKLFSPLSIRRHMMNIHFLQVKICKICSIVFTDFERFRSHKASHKQSVAPAVEDTDTTPADSDFHDNAVTLFICQTCGGLFNGADVLAQHNCPASVSTGSAVAGDSSFAGEFSTEVSQPLPVSITVSQSLPAKASHEAALLKANSQLAEGGTWQHSGVNSVGGETGSHVAGFQGGVTLPRSEHSNNPLLDSVSSMLSSIISLGSMIVKTEAPDDFDTAQAVHTDPVSESSALANMGSEENMASTHDPNMASTHDPNIASTHDPSIASTHDPNIASAHDPNIASTHDPNIASTHGPNIGSANDPNMASPHDTNIASAHEPNMASAHNPNMVSAHDSSTTSAHNRNIASAHDPIMASAHDPNMASTHDPNMALAHDPNMASAHDPNMTSTHDPNMASTHDPNMASAHDPDMASTHDLARVAGSGDPIVSISSTCVSSETILADCDAPPLIADCSLSDSHTGDQGLAVALTSGSTPEMGFQAGILSKVPDQVLAGNEEMGSQSVPLSDQMKGVDSGKPHDAESMTELSQADGSVLTDAVSAREVCSSGGVMPEQAEGLFAKFAKQLDCVPQISTQGSEGHGADSLQVGDALNCAVGSADITGSAPGTETPATTDSCQGGGVWESTKLTRQVDITSEEVNADVGQISERIEPKYEAESDKQVEQQSAQVSLAESLTDTAETANEIILNLELEDSLINEADPVGVQLLNTDLDKHLLEGAEPVDEQMLTEQLENNLLNIQNH